MTKKHTPAPWALKEPRADIYGGHVWLVGEPKEKSDFGIIAKIGGNREKSEIKANADHIVKCVNMHDELLDALEKAADWIDGCGAQSGLGYILDDVIYPALSKAKGN